LKTIDKIKALLVGSAINCKCISIKRKIKQKFTLARLESVTGDAGPNENGVGVSLFLTGVFSGLFVNELVFEDKEEPPDSDEIDSVSKWVRLESVVLSEVVFSDLLSSLGMNSVDSAFDDDEDSEVERDELDAMLPDSAARKICSMIFRQDVADEIWSLAGDSRTFLNFESEASGLASVGVAGVGGGATAAEKSGNLLWSVDVVRFC